VRFEVSGRVTTGASVDAVISFTKNQLSKISRHVERRGDILHATSIEASFGSINRSDDTNVSARPVEGGYIMVAETHYRPSFVFWLFFIAALFSYVGWIIPVIFYFYQRGTVKAALESLFKRVGDEFVSPPEPAATQNGTIADLQALADLRAKGILNDEEFEREKLKVLAR
jgi:uncharacterized membrane protein YciS (DUF1049 family)